MNISELYKCESNKEFSANFSNEHSDYISFHTWFLNGSQFSSLPFWNKHNHKCKGKLNTPMPLHLLDFRNVLINSSGCSCLTWSWANFVEAKHLLISDLECLKHIQDLQNILVTCCRCHSELGSQLKCIEINRHDV